MNCMTCDGNGELETRQFEEQCKDEEGRMRWYGDQTHICPICNGTGFLETYEGGMAR
jgi:DnaJ-class molecular chaperone